MKKLTMQIDENSQNLFAIPFSDHIDQVIAISGTTEQLVVPPDAGFAIFNGTGDFFVKAGSAGVTTATTLGDAAELNPGIRVVEPGTVLFITAGSEDVTVQASYYGS